MTTPLGEPKDWQTGPTLSDVEVLSVVLCRWTSVTPDDQGRCIGRLLRLHPDRDCLTLYHQAEALQAGTVHYDLPAVEVTRSAAGSDPTYITPV